MSVVATQETRRLEGDGSPRSQPVNHLAFKEKTGQTDARERKEREGGRAGPTE